MAHPDTSAAWTRADALVLAVLHGTSNTAPSDLAGLIARADALEHAVLEPREFETAAGRLIAAELITTDGERFWLTEAGSRLCAERLGRGDWSESLAIGLRKLGPPTGEPLELPAGQFRSAVDAYLAAAAAHRGRTGS